MRHIILSGSIGILLAAQAGCGADDGPPWPQADAEQAAQSIINMLFAGGNAASDQPPDAAGVRHVEAPCATGGTMEISSSLSGTVAGNVVEATENMDMTVVACGFDGSTMDGTLTHVLSVRSGVATDSIIEVNGVAEGRLTFTGALAGTCAFDLTWTIDFAASSPESVVLDGRACGQDVSLILANPDAPAGGGDQAWDQEDAMTVAEGIIRKGDDGARALDIESDRAPGSVVELMEQCSPSSSQTLTGTRTETTEGDTFTTEHAFTSVLDECVATPFQVSGTLEYRRVEQLDLTTGARTITADISSQVTSSDPRLPSSACELDLHQDIDVDNSEAFVTGTACGQAVSFTNAFPYIPPVSDQIWDQEKAEDVALGFFEVGNEAKQALDDEHDITPDPVLEVTDLVDECFWEGSQTLTGTRTETTVDSVTTTEYALTLVLDACEASLTTAMSGTLEHLRVEQFDDDTGATTITETISGEVTVSSSRLPGSPCAVDLQQVADLDVGSASITGTACGRSISLNF